MTTEAQMEFNERNEFSRLLSAFGNALFDCGAWNRDFDEGTYQEVFERGQAARKAVEDYVEKLRKGQQ